MRISYSCTANLERIIKTHNQKVLNKDTKNDGQCKCAGSCKYPLKGGNCRTENIVYRATLTLRQGCTSACARLSSDSDTPIIKNLLKAAYMKTTLNSRSMVAA